LNELVRFAQGLQWWHWWVLAAVLAVAETLVPGAVAIWFAASAVVVGALVLVVPVPWQLQLLIFAVLGVVACFVYRRYRGVKDLDNDAPQLNKRAAQYIGQAFTLLEPLSGGSGKVQVGDTTWLARGPDAPAGTRVRVVSVTGSVLQVEPVN
jgi:membrane protein implicated in regulation of membrane protease activity